MSLQIKLSEVTKCHPEMRDVDVWGMGRDVPFKNQGNAVYFQQSQEGRTYFINAKLSFSSITVEKSY